MNKSNKTKFTIPCVEGRGCAKIIWDVIDLGWKLSARNYNKYMTDARQLLLH